MKSETSATARVFVKSFERGELSPADDRVAVEEPLEIRVAEHAARPRSVAITMRTPGADEALAAGFLFSEGIVRGDEDIVAIESAGADNRVTVNLAADVEADLGRLERHFYATSSCGVCGKASLEALETQSVYPPSASDFEIEAAVLCRLPDSMDRRQDAFAATGGLHAAALFDAAGSLVDVCEDVGRHNAVDKLAGRALLDGSIPWHDHGVIVSGRASFELLQKAMMAGTPLLAAVGAPSSLAIDLAWEFGITLVGFLRDGRFNVYSEPRRIRTA